MAEDADPQKVTAEAPKEFTPPASQDELNRIINERLTRERQKFADYNDLKSKAQQWDAVEEKNRTDLERVQAQAEAEKRRADQAELRATKAEVASTKGVPAALLNGSTKEELESAADALLAFRGEVKVPTVTVVNPGNGSATEKSVAAGAALFQERRRPPTTS